jgi:hypothetical protein
MEEFENRIHDIHPGSATLLKSSEEKIRIRICTIISGYGSGNPDLPGISVPKFYRSGTLIKNVENKPCSRFQYDWVGKNNNVYLGLGHPILPHSTAGEEARIAFQQPPKYTRCIG